MKLLGLLLLLSTDLFACSCGQLARKPCNDLQADAVFIGTVLETRRVTHKRDNGEFIGYSMRFRVEESLRSELGPEIAIETGMGGGDCGTPLNPGDRFIVFADRQDDGSLWTGMCSATRYLGNDEESAAIVENYRSLAKQRTSSLYGEVTMVRPIVDWMNRIVPGEPVGRGGVRVSAISGSFRAEAVSGEDGAYEISSLPNGKYQLVAEPPKGWDYEHSEPDDFVAEVANGACERIDFALSPTTRIRGRVVFPSDVQKTVEVSGRPVDMKEVDQFSGKWTYTEGGSFDLWPLPPGDYFVGININGSPKHDSPYPPTYYPGVNDPTHAAIIRLAEGETREIEIPFPEEATPRKVKIRALDSSGKPMQGVYVQIEDLLHPGDAIDYANVTLDKRGKGEFNVFQGYDYHLHAEFRQEMCAPAIHVPPGKEPIAIEVVLSKRESCDIYSVDGLSRLSPQRSDPSADSSLRSE